jgi:methylenetetrahydrofolate dehydrogenase (NADP+)/methenyltetrahydrofolate cyclohydrolase
MVILASMKTYYFDGKAFARRQEEELSKKTTELGKRGVIPKLVSISVGNNLHNSLYLKLKQKAAQRVGCQLFIVNFKALAKTSAIIKEIEWYNLDRAINGIMLQLPLPKSFLKKDRNAIIKSIEKQKDVDGLRNDSAFLTPVVKAIIEIIKGIPDYLSKGKDTKILLVGSKGFEGEKIFRTLDEMGYLIEGVDSKTKDLRAKTSGADMIISATGRANLIHADMVKEGAVLIDVGSPKGDIEKAAYKKASFVSPVPGGVGPVTISCLLENLIKSSEALI